MNAIDLYSAWKRIEKEYKKAEERKDINKPLAFALYQVWKYYDEHERSRNRGFKGRD